MKILFSNIGYAKGFDGGLRQQLLLAHRHFYCPPSVQQAALDQLKAIMQAEQPELCCLLEIDSGSFHSGRLNQMGYLLDSEYAHHDIADKYGAQSYLGRMPLHKGKSNGFLAKREISFERIYFKVGNKRLVYRLQLKPGLCLYFAHFSLNHTVRQAQLLEARGWLLAEKGQVILLGDFNVLRGLGELKPLLAGTNLKLLNNEAETTFTFHKRKLLLDICIASPDLAASLRVIPQVFSDHSALLLHLDGVHSGH